MLAFYRVRSQFNSDIGIVTGAFKESPMGFPTRPTITFITDKSCFLPTASTCALSLKLPLSLVSYESFKENMTITGKTQSIYVSGRDPYLYRIYTLRLYPFEAGIILKSTCSLK